MTRRFLFFFFERAIHSHARGIQIFVLALTCASALPLSATTITLQEGVGGYNGTSDTTIYQNHADNSDGGGFFIYAGVTQDNSPRRALIRFDVSAIPSNATIQSAQLTLCVDRSRPSTQNYTLSRVTSDWGEGTVDAGDPGGFGAAASAGDATWKARHFGVSLWTTAGGDYSTTSVTTLVDIQNTTATFASAGMAADVQAWVVSPSTNFGWLLKGNELSVWNSRRFVSSEGTVGLRPTLTIGYTTSSRVEEWPFY